MKKPFSITIDKELYDRLKILADEQGRTLSNLIEFLLRDAIKR